MIGLTGSHRTGKTTLAEAFAKQTGIPFVRTSGSKVFADLGLDPQANYPFETRMGIQEHMLRAFSRQYASASSGLFIADRTPIDLMAYTLADVMREPHSEEMEKRISAYMDGCFDVLNRHFSMIVVVQPGIPMEADPTKAPIGNAYVEHVANLVMGLTVSERIAAQHFYIPRDMLDLTARVKCVKIALNKVQDRHAKTLGLTYEVEGEYVSTCH